MDSQKADLFMMINGKNFEGHHLISIREKLLSLDENQWQYLQLTQFKNPTTALLISIFAGPYGIDRFYIGDTGLGVGKLLTCGGLFVWTIVDWFLIQGATKEKNFLAFNNTFL
jgi:TM2 domain-containing membrane protein YozV